MQVLLSQSLMLDFVWKGGNGTQSQCLLIRVPWGKADFKVSGKVHTDSAGCGISLKSAKRFLL